MAAGRKIEDEGEARRCLLAVKRSGRTAGEWARARGIDGRSLHAWQMNLERGGRPCGSAAQDESEAAGARLIELIPPAVGVAVAGRGRYVLEIGGARVEFGDDASVVTLRRVLETLRLC